MKNSLIKATIFLVIGGFITKTLGMLIKIIITRTIGSTNYGLYSLITPTMMILISVSQLGLPTALNILISKGENTKKLMFTSLLISLSIDLFLILILLFSARFISFNLLHEKRVTLSIISLGIILPFITISNILRSYYFAKERIAIHVISNIIEDIVKLIIILAFLPAILKKGIEITISFIVLTNIFSELSSIIIFIYFLPNFKLRKSELKSSKSVLNDLFNIALPTTGSRIIGCIGYFLEPIILTFVLLKIGYSNQYILTEYGIINGYVLPLILLPSFFTSALSQALIPSVSKNFKNNNIKEVRRKIRQACFYSLLIGIPCTLLFMFKPLLPLKFIYNTHEGINYIKLLAPICLLHYIQSPISASLQSVNASKEALKGTLYGTIIRTIILFLLTFKMGIYGLIIAIGTNIIIVTIYDIIKINQILKK